MPFLKNGVNINTLFEPRITTAVTCNFVDGVDIGNSFERVSNGSQIAANTGFINGSNSDLRYMYAALGTTSGTPLYDVNGTRIRRNIVWSWDSKANNYTLWSDTYTIFWAGTQIGTSLTPSAFDSYYTYSFAPIGGYTYKAYEYTSYDYSGSQAAGEEIMYYPVYRVVATPTIISFTAGTLNMTVGYTNQLFPNFSGGTGSISPTVGAVSVGYSYPVSPTTTTTYTLTVGGTVSQSLTINVFAAPTASLSAGSTTLNSGSSTTLTPTFTCPGGYASIPQYGNVTSGAGYSTGTLTAASGGGYQAYPFTLTAYNGANAGTYYATSSVTIYVYPLPTAALTLAPDIVDSGFSTTLYPVFANGTGVINQAVGAVTSGASYARTLTGDAYITYTLTCTSPTGATATASASVTVTTGCPTDGVCPRDGVCPAPEVLVLMADGTQRQAGNLVVGDLLQSWNEKFSRFDIEEVTALERGYNERSRIFFSNGLSGLFSSNHRLLLANGEWKEIRDMVSGEMLYGDIYVLGHGPEGIGEVVKITISNLHTYVTLGVISHNLKIPQT